MSEKDAIPNGQDNPRPAEVHRAIDIDNQLTGIDERVIDVTYYPDVTDLCLASDAAILDYSSLRFDYALLRRPMVFLVPDEADPLHAVGAEDLHILREAGATMHGYEEKDVYMVKTTHWYLMQTTDTSFTPQEEEGIEEFDWMPWSRAVEAVGYEGLREHMKGIAEMAQHVARPDKV